MELGEYLKQIRDSKTLHQISAETELEKGYLSKMEQGLRHPKPDKFPALSAAYGVSLTVSFQLSGYLADDLIICRAREKTQESDNSHAREALNELLEND